MIDRGLAVTRLSYDSIVAYKFPTAGHVLLFTGSSLNRSRNANKQKDEDIGQPAAEAGKDDDAGLPAGKAAEHDILRADQNSKQGASRIKRRKKYAIGGKARRTIRARGAAMWRCGRCRTIVTLSFIEYVTDKVAIRCLQNYIRSWRKVYGQNINYLWVAERQKNGNVHFHIITSHFFNIKKENARWVRVQYNAGLKHELPGGVLERDEVEALIRVGELKDFLNPFDVKRIETQSGVISYLTKYITKGKGKKDDNGIRMDQFEFHPWRCSHRVSRIFTGTLVQKETMNVMLSNRNCRVQKKDYYKDGVLRYKKNAVHYPQPYYGLWATKIAVYNERLAEGQYIPLDAVNKKILIDGDKPALEYINEYDYYCLYCREIGIEEINLAMDGVYVNDKIGVGDHLYFDGAAMVCNSFDGKVNAFGRYKIRREKVFEWPYPHCKLNGSFYDCGPYTHDELISMQ